VTAATSNDDLLFSRELAIVLNQQVNVLVLEVTAACNKLNEV
jgi:hypothetical protein